MGNGTTTAAANGVETLQHLYAPIRKDLDRVNDLLRAELLCNHSLISAMSDYAARFQGKRMRSALLLFSAKIAGGVRDEHYTLAAIVELIHLATLAHDDVLDESEKRRLAASLNARWDNEASVMFGDYLFSNAFALCARLKSSEVTSVLARTTQEICAGELSQIALKYNAAITEDQYRDIIDKKTAALFATACRLGASPGNPSAPLGERFARFGLAFGRAFQIIDDCLDITGEEVRTGKPPGNDLAKGKYTLPLIRLLQVLPPRERETFNATLLSATTEEKRRTLQILIDEYEILPYVREQAEATVAAAKREIEATDSPFVDNLVGLAEFTIHRSF